MSGSEKATRFVFHKKVASMALRVQIVVLGVLVFLFWFQSTQFLFDVPFFGAIWHVIDGFAAGGMFWICVEVLIGFFSAMIFVTVATRVIYGVHLLFVYVSNKKDVIGAQTKNFLHLCDTSFFDNEKDFCLLFSVSIR